MLNIQRKMFTFVIFGKLLFVFLFVRKVFIYIYLFILNEGGVNLFIYFLLPLAIYSFFPSLRRTLVKKCLATDFLATATV